MFNDDKYIGYSPRPYPVLQALEQTLDQYDPKVKSLLTNGEALLSRTAEVATPSLRQCLDTLRQRWDNIERARGVRRTRLDDAVKQADEFQTRLGGLMEWLGATEQRLNALRPVSRIEGTIAEQIKEHEVSSALGGSSSVVMQV